jgi:hypothetical protein
MIGWAIGGIEREIAATRERLANLTEQAAALRAKLPSASRGALPMGAAEEAGGVAESTGGRRSMSAAARKRISEMMTKRWAERRKTSGAETSAAPDRKRKRRLSAEARKRISDAQKKRWAEHRKTAK